MHPSEVSAEQQRQHMSAATVACTVCPAGPPVMCAGYADYMQTQEFEEGVQQLAQAAQVHGPTAIMCAEAVSSSSSRALRLGRKRAAGMATAASDHAAQLHRLL